MKSTWKELQEQAAEAKRIAMETGVPIVVVEQKPRVIPLKPGASYVVNTNDGTITELEDP